MTADELTLARRAWESLYWTFLPGMLARNVGSDRALRLDDKTAADLNHCGSGWAPDLSDAVTALALAAVARAAHPEWILWAVPADGGFDPESVWWVHASSLDDGRCMAFTGPTEAGAWVEALEWGPSCALGDT